MYNQIINPLTNEKISIFSNQGKELLKQYVKQYKNGGMNMFNKLFGAANSITLYTNNIYYN